MKIICSLIKNEHKYLEKWITYNFSIGFEKIYLFEDEGSLSHKNITDKFDNVILQKLSTFLDLNAIDESYQSRQVYLYNKFIKQFKDGWCAFIDVDEFIRFDDNYTLDKLISEFSDYNGIELFWKCYNANGNIYSSDKQLDEVYTKIIPRDICTKNLYFDWKVIVNLSRPVKFIYNTHNCNSIVKTNKENPVYNYMDNIACYDKAWIDHYVTMSFQDYYERRIIRGTVTKKLRPLNLFFILNPDMKKIKEDLYKKFNICE